MKFLNYLFDSKHIDSWFRWLSWVSLTAAVTYAWWKTDNHFILPFVLISIVYTWISLHKGFGVFLKPLFINFLEDSEFANILSLIVAGTFTIYAIVALTSLLDGLLKASL
ncbi:hypothetical protein CWI80_01395 [Pseudidiomarina sediminum]|uniref:Uncharacterized protein n=1 Tax=Pseudidiomarina sediminum TaxID=431675 RepID=A0A432Z830_9GAMM|nr:hypothetical protein CWI80_01395 [Pseudidiomarina sediminum]